MTVKVVGLLEDWVRNVDPGICDRSTVTNPVRMSANGCVARRESEKGNCRSKGGNLLLDVVAISHHRALGCGWRWCSIHGREGEDQEMVVSWCILEVIRICL